MVYKLSANLKKQNGITLVEVIIVVFVMGMFSAILISDFPKMQRQFALSRAAYGLAQDLRRTLDLGLSGLQVEDSEENMISVKGYGIYVNFSSYPAETYAIYADVDNNKKYDVIGNYEDNYCKNESNPVSDCIIEIIDVTDGNPSLYVVNVNNISETFTSINFRPPDPLVNIDNIVGEASEVGIVLGLTSGETDTRTVWVNKSGLIRVQ